MKLNKFFDQAIAISHELLELVQKQLINNTSGHKVILAFDSSEKLTRLVTLFSQRSATEFSENYAAAIGHYLNQLIIYCDHRMVHTQRNSAQLMDEVFALDNVMEQSFLFFPTDPVKLGHSVDCPPQLMINYLEELQRLLHIKRQQILSGWQLQQSEKGFLIRNFFTEPDWNLFQNFMGDDLGTPKPRSETENTIDIGGNVTFKSSLTVPQFYAVCQQHGLTLPYANNLRHQLTQVLDALDPGNEESLALRNTQELKSLGAEELCVLVEKTHENGSSQLHEKLQKATYLYRSAQNIHAHFGNLNVTNLDNRRKAAKISRNKTHKNIYQEILQKFPSDITTLLNDLVSDLTQLSQTANTLPKMPEPYNAKDEALLVESFFSIPQVIKKFEALAAFAAATDDRGLIAIWINCTLIDVFMQVADELCAKNYALSTIQLCTCLINLISNSKPKRHTQHSQDLNNVIHDLKDHLINSCYTSGRHELALHWISTIKHIPCSFYIIKNNTLSASETKTNAMEFFFQEAIDLQFCSIAAQLEGELEAAKHYVEQAKICMDNSIKKFAANADSQLAEYFLTETRSFLKILGYCYFAIGVEYLQSNSFSEAIHCFTRFDQLTQLDTYREVIHTINTALRGIKFSHPGHDPVNAMTINSKNNVRWASLRNLLNVKSWIENNLPNNINLLVKKESLILISKSQDLLKKIAISLKRNSLEYTSAKNEITLSNFSTLALVNIKNIFHNNKVNGATALSRPEKNTPQGFSVVASADMSKLPAELLEYRVLKNSHYSTFNTNGPTNAEDLYKEVITFIFHCQNPLLKLKSFVLLVNICLAQAFDLWQKKNKDGQVMHYTRANMHAEEARHFATENLGVDPREVNRLLTIIDSRLADHTDLSNHCLGSLDLDTVLESLNSIHNSTEQKSSHHFHWMRLGLQNILPAYAIATGIRDSLQKKFLCLDKTKYAEREELIRQSSLLCFELAYELFSQAFLNKLPDNTALVAKQRIAHAYHNLCDTQKLLGFKLPHHVQSYIKVYNSADGTQNFSAAMILLDSALNLARTHSNALHQIDILLRKIDWLCGEASRDPFKRIIQELATLSTLLKTTATAPDLSFYWESVILLVAQYLGQNLANSVEALTEIDRSTLDSYAKVTTLELNIIEFFELKITSTAESSTSQLQAIKFIHSLKEEFHETLSVIAAMQLEEETVPIDKLLIPSLLTWRRLLEGYEGELISTTSPLIRLMMICNLMLQRACAEDNVDSATHQQLCQYYNAIAMKSIIIIEKVIQHLIPTLIGEAVVEDPHWFGPFLQLISCLDNDHFAKPRMIAAEHIPLIERMQNLLPHNPALAFGLYRALADNTLPATPCPAAVAACRFAANAGYALAEYWYSRLLQSGDYGCEINFDLAKKYLHKSNMQGFYKAQTRLVKLHNQGLFGCPADYQVTKTYAKAACANEVTPKAKKEKLYTSHIELYIPAQMDYDDQDVDENSLGQGPSLN
jgi:hypothetical protein